MAWSTSYLADLRAVMTVYSGTLSRESLTDAFDATVSLGLQHGATRFIGDCSALEAGPSVVDLYGLAKRLERMPEAACWMEAVVLPRIGVAVSDVRFWENTCRNRGLRVQAFDTMDGARAWILGNGNDAQE